MIRIIFSPEDLNTLPCGNMVSKVTNVIPQSLVASQPCKSRMFLALSITHFEKNLQMDEA